jgi:hypothetical protein
MAMRLEKENVRILFEDILGECDLYGREGKEAENLLCYISGARDMATAVMEAIETLGGK